MGFRNIQIKDFGPIKDADFDIKPLTVFVGPNSSGKSFAALLIHSLLKSNDIYNESNKFNFGLDSLNCLLRNNLEKFKEFDEKFTEMITSDEIESKCFELSFEDFEILINEGIKKYYTYLIENKLKSYFDVENLGDLVRLNQNSFEISMGNYLFYFKDEFKCSNNFIDNFDKNLDVGIYDKSFMFKTEIKEDFVTINVNYLLLKSFYNPNEISYAQLWYIFLADFIFEDLTQKNSYYIPAARDELVKNKEKVISNQLNGVVDLSKIQKELAINLLNSKEGMKKAFLYDLACEMEEDLIGGSIEIVENENNSKIIFVDKENNFKCGTNLVSTSIRELIPLIYYLKYEVNKKDTLIIEEPEAHIHPANQRKLVKYLVKAINEGLKIIFTTHSDFIIDQLNNLIRLCDSSPEAFEKLNLSEDNILNYKDINIYHFKECDDEKYAFGPELIEITREGFSEDNFSKVIDELYDESDLIIDSSY